MGCSWAATGSLIAGLHRHISILADSLSSSVGAYLCDPAFLRDKAESACRVYMGMHLNDKVENGCHACMNRHLRPTYSEKLASSCMHRAASGCPTHSFQKNTKELYTL